MDRAQSALSRIARIERGEVGASLWSFACFFCVLCGYYVLRPLRDEMGVQGGVENLPWLFSATFAAMLAVVPVFGFAASPPTRTWRTNSMFPSRCSTIAVQLSTQSPQLR